MRTRIGFLVYVVLLWSIPFGCVDVGVFVDPDSPGDDQLDEGLFDEDQVDEDQPVDEQPEEENPEENPEGK